MKKQLTLFDSIKKQKLPFEPMEDGKVSVYVCGPTVYDDAHLGHARSAIVFDLLHRVLKANGYEVTFVKNFTDIDDKIIKKIAQSGKSLEELTTHYIQAYQDEMKALHILPNTLEPKATQNIDAMQQMIEKLLEKNIAYIIEDGVYLDTSKDNAYGTLSKKVDDEHSQSRVEVKLEKKDQKDFAL
jgi:cysteinyl-tRNA synthetase